MASLDALHQRYPWAKFVLTPDTIVPHRVPFALARRLQLICNTVLAELAAQVDRRVRWYYTPVARQRGHQSWIEHRDLIAAIAARDEPRATQVMRAHTEHTRKTYHEREK